LNDVNAGLLAEIFVGGAVAGFVGGGNLGAFTALNAAEVEAAVHALRNGVCAEIRKSAENGRPAFEVCLQMAVSLRYYISTLETVISAKVGFTRLSGVAPYLSP
jgi:hypothetical protein